MKNKKDDDIDSMPFRPKPHANVLNGEHPDEHDIICFFLEKFDDEDQELIGRHIEECDECAHRSTSAYEKTKQYHTPEADIVNGEHPSESDLGNL